MQKNINVTNADMVKKYVIFVMLLVNHILFFKQKYYIKQNIFIKNIKMIRLMQNFTYSVRHITSKRSSLLCIRKYEVYFPSELEIEKNKLEKTICSKCNGRGKLICGYCSGTSKVSYEHIIQKNGTVDKTKYICDYCTNGITTCITCIGTGKKGNLL